MGCRVGRHSHPQLIHYYEYCRGGGTSAARGQRWSGRPAARLKVPCCAAREAIARPARLPGPDRGAARAATPPNTTRVNPRGLGPPRTHHQRVRQNHDQRLVFSKKNSLTLPSYIPASTQQHTSHTAPPRRVLGLGARKMAAPAVAVERYLPRRARGRLHYARCLHDRQASRR